MATEAVYDGSIEFEGETYVYDKASVASIPVARCIYTAAQAGAVNNFDGTILLDALEAIFGAYSDTYWRQVGNDVKAFELVMAVYNAERLKN